VPWFLLGMSATLDASLPTEVGVILDVPAAATY
jgi:hypothetical protein